MFNYLNIRSLKSLFEHSFSQYQGVYKSSLIHTYHDGGS